MPDGLAAVVPPPAARSAIPLPCGPYRPREAETLARRAHTCLRPRFADMTTAKAHRPPQYRHYRIRITAAVPSPDPPTAPAPAPESPATPRAPPAPAAPRPPDPAPATAAAFPGKP